MGLPLILVELAAALPAAQADGLEQAYRRWSGPLHAFVQRLTGDAEGTPDLVQESFAKVLASGRLPEGEDAWRNCLYTVAVNLCRDRARRLAVRRTVSLDGLEAAAGPLGDTRPGHGERLELAQAEAVLAGLVAALPQRERAVLLMKKTEGMTFEEIARATGLSVRTAKRAAGAALETIVAGLERAGLAQEGRLV